MSTGRNDPCPCGSEKKYKKCCLPKDEVARQADRPQPIALAPMAALPTPPVELPAAPPAAPDPLSAAWNQRWEEFDAGDYAGQMALFRQTLALSAKAAAR